MDGIGHCWKSGLSRGGGGLYTHSAFAMITLGEVQSGVYRIHDLAMFYTGFGWCPVLVNGEYAPPGDFWDGDEDDIGLHCR